MSSFTLPTSTGSQPCKVTLCPGLSKDQLLSHKPFTQWLSTLQSNLKLQWNQSHAFYDDPYNLRSIEVQAVDRFGHDRIGFVKFRAVVENGDGETLPGAVFLRGGSVAMLVLLQPEDATKDDENELHTILTIQPRIAAGSLAFPEIPAGMIDDSGTFSGAAAKELKEETGLSFTESELIDLTALASSSPSQSPSSSSKSEIKEDLQQAIYPSPGACDEFIPIFLCRKRLPRSQLEEMQGKLTGLREHGEKITLKIVRLGELWREGCRDGKTLAAWALYQGLRGEGRV